MATPAFFVVLAAIVLLGLAALGVVAWHLSYSANAPVAVDWGNKLCKGKNCTTMDKLAVDWGDKGCKRAGKQCHKEDEQAVDWGDGLCTAPLTSDLVQRVTCSPFDNTNLPSQVAVDWGDKGRI